MQAVGGLKVGESRKQQVMADDAYGERGRGTAESLPRERGTEEGLRPHACAAYHASPAHLFPYLQAPAERR